MFNSPIIVLCDESTAYPHKIVGAISVSQNEMYSFEDFCVRFRMENKLFGEIKWDKVKKKGKYVDCYLELIREIFKLPSVRFHSNCYKGDQYKASYALVRSISWKLKHSYLGEIGVLFDKRKPSEVNVSREMFKLDHTFYHRLAFCTETDSKTFSTLQIVDLISGCLAYKINVVNKGEAHNLCKDYFIKEVEKIDGGLDIDLVNSGLWRYDSKLIQHYNLS